MAHGRIPTYFHDMFVFRISKATICFTIRLSVLVQTVPVLVPDIDGYRHTIPGMFHDKFYVRTYVSRCV
jgi:hypothetical protein